MKVAFFHGLESKPRSYKNIYLEDTFGVDNVYAPDMNYKRNNNIFYEVMEYLRENPVDLLIGSSMGGWVAYNLSTQLDIPCLLFNPAMFDRSLEINIEEGSSKSELYVVIGKEDDIIDPYKNNTHFNNLKLDGFQTFIQIEDIGHRIPDDIFRKHVSGVKNLLKRKFI